MNSKSISILREHRTDEKRVIMLPNAVREFVNRGYRVAVEHDAGLLSGWYDSDYEQVGAAIVSRESAWTESSIIFKYKAPRPEEYRYFRRGAHLACFMHAEGNLSLVEAMCRSGMSSYALEFFRTDGGQHPVPASDNEISGKLAILMAAYHLQSHLGGRGILLCHIPGAPRPKVVVIGYGNAGGAAARLAADMGADVTVFGTRWEGLRHFMANSPPNITCMLADVDAFERAIIEADVVVGAILISTFDTPPMLNGDLVRKMKKGAVIIDVTCGYGAGYMPTFERLTSHDVPFVEWHGVLHCKIDAMPASVPATAAPATSSNVWRFLLGMAESIHSGCFDATSKRGLIVSDGRIVHPELARHVAHSTRPHAGEL